MIARGALLSLALCCMGCAGGRPGAGVEDEAKALVQRLVDDGSAIEDATLVGKFLLESKQGFVKGTLRIRYVRPDIYRVDVSVGGAAGVGGGSSFLIEGDSSLVSVSPGQEIQRARLDEASVVRLVRDFDLGLEDLKALGVFEPYLHLLAPEFTTCRSVSGGYLLEGHGPGGDILSIWLDNRKEAVVRGMRADENRRPVVETRLSRFKHFDGRSRPMRRVMRHFEEEASLSVQYDRVALNLGLTRQDLLVRGSGR